MEWFLPDRSRVIEGLHPHEWDGRPVRVRAGVEVFDLAEPIWREISILPELVSSPEALSIRSVELLARWVGIVVPTLVSPHAREDGGLTRSYPLQGRVVDAAMIGQVGRATAILRQRMSEQWNVEELASAISVSRAQLTRLFSRYAGMAPMRYLAEIRLTEFTRLIEETEMSVAAAARAVGWRDPRVAAKWFARRFGIGPLKYRTMPHPYLPRNGRELLAPDVDSSFGSSLSVTGSNSR